MMDEVRRLSGAFIGAEAAVDDGASQPLLRRQSTRQEGRLQFQAEQQQAAQNAVLSLSWAFLFFHVVIINLMLFIFFVEVKSWYVLFVYGGGACDKPLTAWLTIRLFLSLNAPLISAALGESETHTATFIMRLLFIGWLIVGQNWTDTAVTCKSTSPELFHWCDYLVNLGIFLILLSFMLRVLVLIAIISYIWMVNHGHARSPQAAREETLNSLEKVEYDPALFVDDAVPGDARPTAECCCCMENFSHEKEIIRTPCKHYFHKSCLGDWLKLARTCPLCRCDLDQATFSEHPKEVVENGPEDQTTSAADAV
mmetsp:Transcript_120491/g.212642  ORF Transcript_120491/g.212642 Transcript_120491/m.212642 type:complete len:311 (+) Transcript_120491:38-970(+)